MKKLIINIEVPALDAGITFYTVGLGFSLQRTLFQRSVAELTLGDSMVYLIEQAADTKPYPDAREVRTFTRHWTPVHLDVVVDDMATALSKAIGAGAMLSGEPSTHTWGKLTPLADPFGHGVCLVEFSIQGYDAVAD